MTGRAQVFPFLGLTGPDAAPSLKLLGYGGKKLFFQVYCKT